MPFFTILSPKYGLLFIKAAIFSWITQRTSGCLSEPLRRAECCWYIEGHGFAFAGYINYFSHCCDIIPNIDKCVGGCSQLQRLSIPRGWGGTALRSWWWEHGDRLVNILKIRKQREWNWKWD